MTMDEPVYCLSVILKQGGEVRVYGTQSQLRPALDTFSGPDLGSEDAKIKVTGFTDTADQAPLDVVVRIDDVAAMSLCRQY